MIPQNIKALITALIDKTAEKKTSWNKTSRPNEFKLLLEKGAVTTDNWEQNGTDNVDFAIYNVSGEKVDSFSGERGEENYIFMMQLHSAAKREYHKVDETISSLFNEIKSEKNIGKKSDEDGLPF